MCRILTAAACAAGLTLAGCAATHGRALPTSGAAADKWRTTAERTDYVETGRYDDVVAFCRRLADASPLARYASFGVSGEGRELPLLILSSDKRLTPAAARKSDKPLVLVQNCIHAGECAGKDASLELARDILITGERANLLEHVNMLIMPIFSVDGHERFSPYSRINQNGPKEMGWRVTADNLNLNRDYTKADSHEMRAWLGVWNEWRPDFLFDNHTTNGSDHQYTLFYSATIGALIDPDLASWMSATLLETILPQLEAEGHRPFPYGGPRDGADLSKGIDTWFAHTPRFSTGYAAVCNRPSILTEVHALKPYKQRVRATYDVMVHVLEELNRDPAALRDAVRAADARCAETHGGDGPKGEVVLRLERTEDAEPVTYKSVEFKVRKSDITGGDVIDYSAKPIDVRTTLYNTTRVAQTIAPPAAYIIPPQWTEIIDRLDLHGVEYFRLGEPRRLAVGSYRFEDVKFAQQPFESRFLPEFKTVPINATCEFAAGSVVVPLDQPRAKLAVHLLEPDAPDSLVKWGLINQIFEQKEYAEGYVMEPIARKMLEDDPALKSEFEEKLRTDEEFAKNPGARLNFFYERSPFQDERLNVFPIGRLEGAATLEKLPCLR